MTHQSIHKRNLKIRLKENSVKLYKATKLIIAIAVFLAGTIIALLWVYTSFTWVLMAIPLMGVIVKLTLQIFQLHKINNKIKEKINQLKNA